MIENRTGQVWELQDHIYLVVRLNPDRGWILHSLETAEEGYVAEAHFTAPTFAPKRIL